MAFQEVFAMKYLAFMFLVLGALTARPSLADSGTGEPVSEVEQAEQATTEENCD